MVWSRGQGQAGRRLMKSYRMDSTVLDVSCATVSILQAQCTANVVPTSICMRLLSLHGS